MEKKDAHTNVNVAYAVQLVHATCCLAGSASYLDDVRAERIRRAAANLLDIRGSGATGDCFDAKCSSCLVAASIANAPGQLPSLAGQEHGRTIPSADIAPPPVGELKYNLVIELRAGRADVPEGERQPHAIGGRPSKITKSLCVQVKTWREAANAIQDAATKFAAGRRADVDAAVTKMKADATEAEARSQKLNQAGNESLGCAERGLGGIAQNFRPRQSGGVGCSQARCSSFGRLRGFALKPACRRSHRLRAHQRHRAHQASHDRSCSWLRNTRRWRVRSEDLPTLKTITPKWTMEPDLGQRPSPLSRIDEIANVTCESVDRDETMLVVNMYRSSP